MEAAYTVSLEEKACKSIKNRRGVIVNSLRGCKGRVPNNDICKEIVRMMQSIVKMNHGTQSLDTSAPCSRCAIVLQRNKVMRCSKCDTCYCSRDCQLKDWREGGHKEVCKILVNERTAGLGRVRSKLERREDALYDNSTSAGFGIYRENRLRFTLQAIMMGYGPTEYVCIVDLRAFPNETKLMTFDDLLSTYFKDEDMAESIIKERDKQEKVVVTVGFLTWGISRGLSSEEADTESRQSNVLLTFHKCGIYSGIAKCLRQDSEWYETNRSAILKEKLEQKRLYRRYSVTFAMVRN